MPLSMKMTPNPDVTSHHYETVNFSEIIKDADVVTMEY